MTSPVQFPAPGLALYDPDAQAVHAVLATHTKRTPHSQTLPNRRTIKPPMMHIRSSSYEPPGVTLKTYCIHYQYEILCRRCVEPPALFNGLVFHITSTHHVISSHYH